MRHYMYVPENLDLDEILELHEFKNIPAFHKDNMMYILNLIAEIPSRNKDLVTEDGYTPINADLLRRWIGRHYLPYLNYLVNAGVIESNNQYLPGKKSIGYRYTSLYNVGVVKKLVTDLTLYNKLNNLHMPDPFPGVVPDNPQENAETGAVDTSVYQPADKWYRSGLIQINPDLANAYISALCDYKLSGDGTERWDSETAGDGTLNFKNPMVQYRGSQINIDKIAAGRFYQHYDDNIYRYHSAITQCKRELRNAITIDGKEVTTIDLSNSQPTLLTLTVNYNFWTATEGFKVTDISYLGIENMFTSSNFTSFINMCRNAQHNEDMRSEILEFVRLVSSGEFYSAFRVRLQTSLGRHYEDDKAVKPLLFTVLFTSNRYLGQPEAAPKRVFKEWFPNVYELTSAIKVRDSANLAILLQRIESYIMFNKIVARIAREEPELPFIPIHDSIATIRGNEDYVERVMSEELTSCLGFMPHFKREEWRSEKLITDIERMKSGM